MFGFFEGVSFDPARDVPDLSGKVALITGGNAGLGKETVTQLAKHRPSRLYLGARTLSKAEDAIRDIKAIVPGANIIFLQLDLASFASVKTASDTFLASCSRLDLLVNNAGVMALPAGLTADGYELQFGTNHMGHALLTKLLLPTLQQTAQQAGADVRVVSLSSAGHRLAPKAGIVFRAATTDMADYGTFQRYGMSKAANILFASELARRYPDITSVSVHPGIIETDLSTPYRTGNGLKGRAFGAVGMLFGKSLAQGARNQLWCATGKGVVSGQFYFPVGVRHVGWGFPNNEVLGQRLWEWTEEEFKKKGYT